LAKTAKGNKAGDFKSKSGRVEGTKELIISNSPYMIIYRVKGESVEILRILHTSKRYPE
jgi:toxin ParE1/3/4